MRISSRLLLLMGALASGCGVSETAPLELEPPPEASSAREAPDASDASGASEVPVPSPDASPAPDAGTAAPPDAAPPVADVGPGGSGGPGGPPDAAVITGSVVIVQELVDGQPVSSVSADFTPAVSQSACQMLAQNGVCTLLACPITQPPAGAVPTVGPIEVLGGLMPVTLVPRADGRYDPVSRSGALFVAGALLHVEAPFAPQPIDIPIRAPLSAEVFGPAFQGRVLDVPVDQDLTFHLTRPSTTGLELQLLPPSAAPGPNSNVIVCSAQGFTTQIVVPSTLLTKMPRGLGAYAIGTVQQASSGGVVALAVQGAMTPSGSSRGVASYR